MSFKVQIATTGQFFTVDDNDSVLDAALRQGLNLPHSCRSGNCGACKGRIVSGQVKYNQDTPALSPQEKAAGLALFCRAMPETDLVIALREAKTMADVMIKRVPCRVAKMELLAPDVMRLYLKLPATERLNFSAGQYVDFILHDGERRSFSIANAPHDDAFLELHVRRVPGGAFAEHVFTQMKEKDVLRLEGPFGRFCLQQESARPMIFMAGGTGLAPIKGIIEHAFATAIQRDMRLYWGVRARVDLYLNDVISAWAAEHPNFSYVPVLMDPASNDDWRGRQGFVHNAIAEDVTHLGDYDIYASGPPVMVKAGRDIFIAQGLPVERYFSDAFEFAHAPK